MTKVLRFFRNEEGVTAIEYGVLAALIIVVCIATIRTLGTSLNTTFSTVAGAL